MVFVAIKTQRLNMGLLILYKIYKILGLGGYFHFAVRMVGY